MPAITESAPAKINLALHVRRRRPDGYHDLETLFAFATQGDVVTVDLAPADSFTITGPFASVLLSSPAPVIAAGLVEASGPVSCLPNPDRGTALWAGNLVTAAADAFRAEFGIDAHHAITLEKHLPIASGIGGGSADAAATLRALARLHGIASADARLYAIAADLGADVPACLANRTVLGTGKGDMLTAVEGLAGTPLLLINPGVAVSTPAVFKAWDGRDRGAIADGDLITRAHAGRNDLEPAALNLAPVIAEVRMLLDAASGIILARMSGSGATCFGLFETIEARDMAANAARSRGWWTLATELA